MHSCWTKVLASAATVAITLLPAGSAFAQQGGTSTATPIQHLVVIFQENVSFDHYFGTYPNAANPPGEPAFHARPNTPVVNGLSPALLTNNPNLNPANDGGATNPFRLDRSQAVTRDQGHGYKAEQQAFDGGVMDLFPKYVGKSGPPPVGGGILSTTGLNLGYFDGNTVTALWNYAQRFAMNDNSYSTVFGPSTPGLLNLVSGQTNGATNIAAVAATFAVTDGGSGSFSVISDPDPVGDVCSNPAITVSMTGKNVGDLLSAAGVSWGSFMGGFDLTATNANGTTGCLRSSSGFSGTTKDYIPHHAFFQYSGTSNPSHTRPASLSEIGNSGPANHNYDITDFFAAVKAGNFPAVSFLKAPAFQDGHAGYSNPLDEQTFIVNVVNFLQQQPSWSSTAVVIMYDDSDGWYDHQMSPIVNQSQGSQDALTAPGFCGASAPATALPGVDPLNLHALGRCGYGPRQPLLVVSPWARVNYVDHSITDQSSVLRFIEDNWLGGQRIGQGSFDAIAGPINGMFDFSQNNNNQGNLLILDPNTGNPPSQN